MNRYFIDLVPEESQDRRDYYGIPLVSATLHDFVGRRIHNPHHRHQLSVWDNAKRPGGDSGKMYISPKGRPTNDRYSFLWSPEANVITAHPTLREHPEIGPNLQLGDVIVPRIHGYELGTFQIRANPHDNPHMVQVDTASSASRQHFIDTGDYLTPEEAQEASS